MGITDIFSKRQARARGKVPDVYVYDDIPKPLRVQVVHIWSEVLGDQSESATRQGPLRAYPYIVSTLCQEYGVYRLATPPNEFGAREWFAEMVMFLEAEQDAERILDVIELSFRVIDLATRDFSYLNRQKASEIADDAIATLNGRFKEHGVGYRYENGQIIRIDSELLHSETVRPALALLQEPIYKGAQVEFLSAHAHYRARRTKEALVDCLKAFESVMKVICDKRGWPIPSRATASNLVTTLFNHHLIPSYLEAHYSALRATLESGVPTVRNNNGGHGQGGTPITVPDHLVAYTLHMTASAIVFLVESEKALGK